MTQPPADEPKPDLQAPATEPENILVAVDSSNGSERVLDMAMRLARNMPDATIHILHVFRMGKLDRSHAGAPVPSSDAMEDAKEHLASYTRLLKRRTRSAVVSHFAVGDPTTEILRRLGELDVDVLVCGTHDYSGFERWLMGNVAETLMRKAGCPVFIVRPKNHKHH